MQSNLNQYYLVVQVKNEKINITQKEWAETNPSQ